MKKIFKRINAIMLIFVLCLLSACGKTENLEAVCSFSEDRFSSIMLGAVDSSDKVMKLGIYLSYLDLPSFSFSSEDEMRDSIEKAAQSISALGCTDVFLQVRAFGDALYNSSIYPSMGDTVLPQFKGSNSFVELFVSSFHSAGIKVHAWINPYRLRGSRSDLYADFPQEAIISWGDGLYLNPSSDAARKIIIDGVKELIGFDFDGIHFDDYFYPTINEEFDEAQYLKYQSGGGDLELSDWRRENVNKLIREVYSIAHDADMSFSVSPDGSIERCINTHYADVRLWCSEQGYADFICPQLYYGFSNENMPFEKTLNDWAKICKGTKIMPVLSAYKIGREDRYAGLGEYEWLTSGEILARQYLAVSEREECVGVSLFRFLSIFEPSAEVSLAVRLEMDSLTEALL